MAKKLEVNANRMELLRLKKRVVLARRGWKLLKDKQDELMRNFLDMVKENRQLRLEIEQKLAAIYRTFDQAYAIIPADVLKTALLLPNYDINISVSKRPVMNLRLPVFSIEAEGNLNSYGFGDTNFAVDSAVVSLDKLMHDLIRLAEIEKSCEELADEIENTRRRVNALEYILIPNIEETIRYISMKISEAERSTLSRLMKVKEIVRKH